MGISPTQIIIAVVVIVVIIGVVVFAMKKISKNDKK